MPVVTDYTALIGGFSWNGIEVSGRPVIVTYSFPTAAASYVGSIDGFSAATAASFEAFSAAEQAAARTALGEWAAASGITFIEVAPGQGDITFQLVDFDTTSYAGRGGIGLYPFGDWNFFTYPSFSGDLDAAGDVFMNSRFESGDTVDYRTLLHEIGHAIGLKHPTEVVTDTAADPDVVHDEVLSSDDPTRTIMATVGGPPGTDTLQQLDKDAAAFLYGAAGSGGVVTANASGSNAVLSAWSWNATTQVLTETGFAGADTIRGSSVQDVIQGLGGDDRLFGLAGNDTLDGGDGADFLHGGAGDDSMKGGAGDDTYFVDSGADKTVEKANGGYDSVIATVSVTLAKNIELLQLLGGGLTGKGNALDNTIYGDGTFASTLQGRDGNDYIVGGAGDDKLDGGAGTDSLYGGAGNDSYTVDSALDWIGEASGGGTDKVFALVSYTLAASEEIERLYADAGATGLALTGNGIANRIYGAAGNDTLSGAGGKDVLDGDAGNDRLIGGAGIDTLYGRAGADVFVLSPLAADRDTVQDFEHGIDRLEAAAASFGGGLTPGALAASRFVVNTTGEAGDADDRFIYESDTGFLYFDADGTGPGARQQIATLTGIPTLTASDILIA